MNTFQWLLILGFPPSLAAATVAPEIFTDEETRSGREAAASSRAGILPAIS